jgi:DNA-binding response OmpR family regulator
MAMLTKKSQPKRILFVDDEAGIRATLPLVLRRHGFDVAVCSSATEAIKQIEAEHFDLLLCDLNIHKMGDGYDVVQAMRRANPRCASIILTGYPGLESAIEGIHLAIDDYVIKPSETPALIATIAKQIAAREPKARILSVSYDEVLLTTRGLLLQREGYEVISASDLKSALLKCEEGDFDLFLLGHSIDPSDKRKMVEAFRLRCDGPVVSLRRNAWEENTDGADYHISPDPEPLLKLITEIIGEKKESQVSL